MKFISCLVAGFAIIFAILITPAKSIATEFYTGIDYANRSRIESTDDSKNYRDKKFPFSLFGFASAADSEYFSYSHLNFELMSGTFENKMGAEDFVLNEVYLQTKPMLTGRVAFSFGRQLLTEGFDLSLLDGAKAYYHITPKILVTAYGGSARFDEGFKRLSKSTPVHGLNLAYYNERDFTASVFWMEKGFKNDVSKNFVGTNANKKFFTADDSFFELFFNTEGNLTDNKLVQSVVGAGYTLRKDIIFGIDYGVYKDFYDFYKRTELVKDFFQSKTIRELRPNVSIYWPYGIETFGSHAHVWHDGGYESDISDIGISKNISFLIDRITITTGNIQSKYDRLAYVAGKLIKSLIAKKLDLILRYSLDEYDKINNIHGRITSTDGSLKYYISDKFDAEILVARDTRITNDNELYAMAYLSFYNF